MSDSYTSTRVRGFADRRPQEKSRRVIRQVEDVLEQYSEHLLLMLRHVCFIGLEESERLTLEFIARKYAA